MKLLRSYIKPRKVAVGVNCAVALVPVDMLTPVNVFVPFYSGTCGVTILPDVWSFVNEQCHFLSESGYFNGTSTIT